MRNRTFALGLLALSLAGCEQQETASPRADVEQMQLEMAPGSDASTQQFGFMEAMETGPVVFGSGAQSARDAALMVESSANSQSRVQSEEAPAITQIAYAYSWGFRVSAEDLPTLQQNHQALCQAMGDECRVISLSQSGNDDYAYGRMELQVAASQVDALGQRLNSVGDDLDAEQISFAISGEDLTDDIIDNEARLEARTALRDRLMEVLRNRQGSVGDLVEAERGVAEVNEEIDATRSRLENLRGRVAYSAVSIEYDPGMGEYTTGFWSPISYAIGAVGSTLGVVIAGLIYVAVALVPITLFLLGLRWLWIRSGLRLRRRKEENV